MEKVVTNNRKIPKVETWKVEEVKLLRSDIEERLQKMGIDPLEAKTLAIRIQAYTGPGSNDDIDYLNARYRRIEQLFNY